MYTVADILRNKGSDIWTIRPDQIILDALVLMAEKRIGALLVMDGDKLVGIVSERDYARKVALEGRSSRQSKVSEIMSHKVLCVRPDQQEIWLYDVWAEIDGWISAELEKTG